LEVIINTPEIIVAVAAISGFVVHLWRNAVISALSAEVRTKDAHINYLKDQLSDMEKKLTKLEDTTSSASPDKEKWSRVSTTVADIREDVEQMKKRVFPPPGPSGGWS